MTYTSTEFNHAMYALNPTCSWNYLHTGNEECPETEEQFANVGYYAPESRSYKHSLVPFTWEQLKNQLALSRTVLQWQDLRETRDKLLAETDWMVTMATETGNPISDAWKTYRQALRDVPANTSDPANPTWPTKPS